MLVRTIKKNNEGIIEIRDTNSEIGLDNELAYAFDPTGRIIVDHPTDSRSILIAQSDDLRQGIKVSVPIDSQEFELQIHNQEDVFVIEDRSSLKNELVKLFSKGGASGEGLGYRELYGRIEFDANEGKPKLVIEFNTLGFVPVYNKTIFDSNNNFIRNVNESQILLNSEENYISTQQHLHPSIASIDKVQFYATKRLELYRETVMEHGVHKEDLLLNIKVWEVIPIQTNVFTSFQLFAEGMTQTIPVTIQVPDTQLGDITAIDGLCDNSGDNFFNTLIHIVVLD